MEIDKNNEIIFEVSNTMNSSRFEASRCCNRHNLASATASHSQDLTLLRKQNGICDKQYFFQHENTENWAKI
jgi:hypothetical protein